MGGAKSFHVKPNFCYVRSTSVVVVTKFTWKRPQGQKISITIVTNVSTHNLCQKMLDKMQKDSGQLIHQVWRKRIKCPKMHKIVNLSHFGGFLRN